MNTIFQFQNVTKQYRDKIALENISFDIQQGEILGYIGPNGAGKTTTIKILVGLIKSFNGSIQYNDQDMDNPEGMGLLHQELGYLPQEVDFQNWRTVDHALRTFGLLSGIPRDHIDESITKSLEKVGLSDVRQKKIIHLSGGMKQKLKFAQALMHNPTFLVLDEPMSGLDPSSRFHVKNMIKELNESGITIFFSSHILNDIENLATRIAIIHNGVIMKIGTPNELRDEFRIGNDINIEYTRHTAQLTVDNLECIQSISQETELEQIVHCKSEANPDDAMHAILQFLSEHHINIKRIMLQEPNLEQVYLHYVGGEQLQ